MNLDSQIQSLESYRWTTPHTVRKALQNLRNCVLPVKGEILQWAEEYPTGPCRQTRLARGVRRALPGTATPARAHRGKD